MRVILRIRTCPSFARKGFDSLLERGYSPLWLSAPTAAQRVSGGYPPAELASGRWMQHVLQRHQVTASHTKEQSEAKGAGGYRRQRLEAIRQ